MLKGLWCDMILFCHSNLSNLKNWISNALYFDQELVVEMYRNCMFHLCSLAYVVGPEMFISQEYPLLA
jgi:hypothetical protein